MGDAEDIPTWDITPIVERTDPEFVKESLNRVLEEGKSFESMYKERISELTPEELFQVYKRIDELCVTMHELFAYAYLSFSADSTDSSKVGLFGYARDARSKLEEYITFVGLELSKRLQHDPEIINEPVLFEYRHALEKVLLEGRHHLSEKEEQLILQKDRYGVNAWSLLHETLRATRRYKIEIDQEEQELGYMELASIIMSNPNRDTRRKASIVLHEGVAKDRILWSITLQSVFGDFISQMRMRKYPDMYSHGLLQNDIDRSTFDALIAAMRNHTDLIQRYLKLKARIMNLPRLASYDIYAPAFESDSKITWSEARKLIVDSYREFDVECGNFVESLFVKRRIDAEIRPGKTGFGYCMAVPTKNTAWIMINFDGSPLMASGLAHEAGHALHIHLASRKHLWKNLWCGTCLAESASTFGQLLLDEKLVKQADNETKISIICHILDNFRLNVFDQLVRFIFETNALGVLENNKNLDADKLDTFWAEARREVYNDTVDWTTELDVSWALPVHHFMPNFRFYNYPYSFGQLLVFALHGLYKKEGNAFPSKFKQILTAGGSMSPRELLIEVGFDISDVMFWEIGFNRVKELIDELETLVTDLGI